MLKVSSLNFLLSRPAISMRLKDSSRICRQKRQK